MPWMLATSSSCQTKGDITMKTTDLNLTVDERQELEAWGKQMAARAETAEFAADLKPTPPTIVALQRAAAKRSHLIRQAEDIVRAAVKAARTEGLSWNLVGQALGVTGEAARQRYSAV